VLRTVSRRGALAALALGSAALLTPMQGGHAIVGADQSFRCIGCSSFKAGARDILNRWLSTLKANAGSKSEFFIGKESLETNSSLSAWRMLVIVPSEYVRDSSSDWDMFEIVMYTDPDGLVSVENYQRRGRGVSFASAAPSPDREYDRPDNALSNARLRNVRNALLQVAEAQEQTK
jgi:hypothetical protein